MKKVAIEKNLDVNIHVHHAIYSYEERKAIVDKVKNTLPYIPDFVKNRNGNFDYTSISPKDELDNLTEDYWDEPKNILDLLVNENMQSNFLMTLMGYLITTDLADYYDDPKVYSIVVDRFVIYENDVKLILKTEADEDVDRDKLDDYIDGQVSDGWGENGTEPVEYWAGQFKGDLFKKYIYEDSVDSALANLRVIEELYSTSDSIPDYYRDEVRISFTSFIFKPSLVSISLSII